MVRLILGTALILIGVIAFAISLIGVFRFKYVLNRMHAAAIGDTLGLLSVLLGSILLQGASINTVKLLLVLVFIWMSSPVSGHLIARSELLTHPHIEKECEVERR